MYKKRVPVFLLACFLLASCNGGAPPEPVASPTSAPTSTPTPQPTATTDPVGLRFIDIPGQVAPQGQAFAALDTYTFLRYRDFSAAEMTWNAVGSEHIAVTVADGVVTAASNDPAWIGSEAVQVEACEPTGACVTQEITYSVLDETAFSDVSVTFVGNSGFLITVGGKKVLIDAFFEGFPSEYVLPEDVQDALVNAEPPFDDVDLILATHAHDDHFSARMVRRHMQNNPDAIFISTTQAASQLTEFGERVIAADPTDGAPVQVEANGIQVDAIYMSHGYPPNDPNEIFNNAYVFTVNGIKAFHTGDCADLRDILQYNLSEMGIDFAFIQHFYLQDGNSRSILSDGIGEDYLFPIHYQYTNPEYNRERVLSNYPEAIVFGRELETWYMPLPGN